MRPRVVKSKLFKELLSDLRSKTAQAPAEGQVELPVKKPPTKKSSKPQLAEFYKDKPGAHWKALASWLKEGGHMSGRARQIAWGIGTYLNRGWALSPKQVRAGERIWLEACVLGWSLDLAKDLAYR